jgi:amidohydrolase
MRESLRTWSNSELISAARGQADAMLDLRRVIHRNPEVGLSTPTTVQAVAHALAGLDVDLCWGEGETTWLTVLVRGKTAGPTILLRADTDALRMTEPPGPSSSTVTGLMHACGHDAHTAMLMGAAKLLAGRRDRLVGDVLCLFQPGEEGCFGATHCLADGALAGVEPEAAFALHVDPLQPSGTVATRAGPLLAGSTTFEVNVRGRGGHGSEPHLGVDPVTVACEIALALQVAATRTLDPFDPGVITVTRVAAGTTRNVMPSSATLLGTARYFTAATEQRLADLLHRVPAGIAAAHRAEADLQLTPGYRPTVNDPALATFGLEMAGSLGAPARALELERPRMGSEDFSTYLEHMPGVMFMLGVRPAGLDGHLAAPLHSSSMVVDDDAMVVGAAFLAALCFKYKNSRS